MIPTAAFLVALEAFPAFLASEAWLEVAASPWEAFLVAFGAWFDVALGASPGDSLDSLAGDLEFQKPSFPDDTAGMMGREAGAAEGD